MLVELNGLCNPVLMLPDDPSGDNEPDIIAERDSPVYFEKVSSVIPTPSNWWGLIESDTDKYFCNCYGPEKAVTLEGSDQFIRKASNLFISFGNEYGKRIIKASKFNSVLTLIPMSEMTILTALRRYLFGTLRRHSGKVVKNVILDEGGDYLDTDYSGQSEEETMAEAGLLAVKFYSEQMPSNSNFYYATMNPAHFNEYSFGTTCDEYEHG